MDGRARWDGRYQRRRLRLVAANVRAGHVGHARLALRVLGHARHLPVLVLGGLAVDDEAGEGVCNISGLSL